MQQQPPPPTVNSASSVPFSPNTITTEQIQKYLDENKNLIMAILENQNLGKLGECAQYQAILQRNLMYLAAIADAQPQTSSTAPQQQMPQSSGPQQGGNNVQQQTQPTSFQQQQQQQGVSSVPKLPFQLNALRPQDQQHQLLQFQAQHQQFQAQAAAANNNNGMHQMLLPSGNLMEGRGNKQNSLETNSSEGGGQGK